jgi:trigger factor
MTDNDTNNDLTAENEPTAAAEPENDAVKPEADEKEKEFQFVEEPEFDLQYKGDCAYEVKVTVPLANEHKLAEEKIEELRHEAEVPGFRRGKAPRKLIERKFSKFVKTDVEQELLNAAFKKLIKDKNLSPINPPEVVDAEAILKRPEDQPLAFTLKFEVRPRVELGKYRGIEVERPVFRVEDKDINEAIDNMRSRFAVYETLEGGEAAEGDQAVIDFRGTIEDEEFPGGSAQNYPYILGSKRFFPEFEDALKGTKQGEKVACKVNFPEDYSAENLRGKTADFAITINEIKRRNMPELTDDFAKQAGYESSEDMRQKVASRLQENYASEGNMIAEDKALHAIIDSSTFELPKSMVAAITHDHFEERMKELRARHIPAAQVEEMEATVKANAEQTAVTSIKNWITVQEIAEAEGIEVTDEDFEKEATAISMRTGAPKDAAAHYLGEEERRSSYTMRFLRSKVMAAVLSHATVTDKELSPEEFMKEVEKSEESAGETGEDE